MVSTILPITSILLVHNRKIILRSLAQNSSKKENHRNNSRLERSNNTLHNLRLQKRSPKLKLQMRKKKPHRKMEKLHQTRANTKHTLTKQNKTSHKSSSSLYIIYYLHNIVLRVSRVITGVLVY